jgi:CBS domain containing-hemolysin-like protein
MLLLITFVLLAVGVSFLCSIAEAVLLSSTTSYVLSLEKEGRPSGRILKALKDDINSPLAVILTLNTIAHTIGAAGAGAQATLLFGNVYLGVFSAVLTLVILVFSEIIPKALGAHYWRALAPMTGFALFYLIKILYPFVVMSRKLTGWLASSEEIVQGFSRNEFAAMAELGEQEGELEAHEAKMLQNIFSLQEKTVREVMTPRSVIFSLSEENTLQALLEARDKDNFSRIPVYDSEPDNITGFVLRMELLMSSAHGEADKPLREFRRDLPAILDKFSLLAAFDQFLNQGSQIMLVVNEYGETQGLITLEDVFEELLGTEITDESDAVEDMQKLARSRAVLKKIRIRSENSEAQEHPRQSK